jgi:hypothetical protein
MNTNDSQPAEARQGDLDDLPGTYTFDDGHAGSYDHEATVSVGDDATVTVTCACGEWERTAFGDAAVLAEWEAHVYTATGRGETAASRPGWREDGRVDIDAVRAGTPYLEDMPAIYESLCDEVERLRAALDEVADDRDDERAVTGRHMRAMRSALANAEAAGFIDAFGDVTEGGVR